MAAAAVLRGGAGAEGQENGAASVNFCAARGFDRIFVANAKKVWYNLIH